MNAGCGFDREGRVTHGVGWHLDGLFDGFDPEDGSHLRGLGVWCRRVGLAQQECDVVGSAAEEPNRRRRGRGNENGGCADDVLLADVIPQQNVWIVQRFLCDGAACDKRTQILRDPGRVRTTSRLASKGNLLYRITTRYERRNVHCGDRRWSRLRGLDESLSLDGRAVGNGGHARDRFSQRSEEHTSEL